LGKVIEASRSWLAERDSLRLWLCPVQNAPSPRLGGVPGSERPLL